MRFNDRLQKQACVPRVLELFDFMCVVKLERLEHESRDPPKV